MVFILLSRTKRNLANAKLLLEMISKGITGKHERHLDFYAGRLTP